MHFANSTIAGKEWPQPYYSSATCTDAGLYSRVVNELSIFIRTSILGRCFPNTTWMTCTVVSLSVEYDQTHCRECTALVQALYNCIQINSLSIVLSFGWWSCCIVMLLVVIHPHFSSATSIPSSSDHITLTYKKQEIGYKYNYCEIRKSCFSAQHGRLHRVCQNGYDLNVKYECGFPIHGSFICKYQELTWYRSWRFPGGRSKDVFYGIHGQLESRGWSPLIPHTSTYETKFLT